MRGIGLPLTLCTIYNGCDRTSSNGGAKIARAIVNLVQGRAQDAETRIVIVRTCSIDEMYGPPPNCKRFEVGRRNSPRKCIRPLRWRIGRRALDDDPHASVLINRWSRKTHFHQQVFRRVVGLFFRLFSPQQTLVETYSKRSSSWRLGTQRVHLNR